MSHQHHHHHHHQQHSYHQAIPNSWYPEPAIVAPTGPHQIQQHQQQIYNGAHAPAGASPSLDTSVIGASDSAASSPVATRPDVGPSQQPVTPSNTNNNYYQPPTYQEPANAIYQCQQDYYNHRVIEPFQQQQTHQPPPPPHPPNATHGWTSNASPAEQTTSAQVVGNVNHLHICQGLMDQVSGSSTSYSSGVSNINQQHPISVTTSYTNGYSQHQHYQQHQDNVHQILQQNNSNHNAIIQPSLQQHHNQEDIYANQCHRHNDHQHHNPQHPQHHQSHHLHSQTNPLGAQIYNPHQQQRGSPVISMHSGITSSSIINKQDPSSEPLRIAGNDQMQHVPTTGNQLYPMSSRPVINPQHYQQKVGNKQGGMSIIQGHVFNPSRSQQPVVATTLTNQQQQQLTCGIGTVSPKTTQNTLPGLSMASTGSGGQICRKQSSSVISTSSIGSNSSDHLSPTELACATNQTTKFSIISGRRLNNSSTNNNNSTPTNETIKSEPDQDLEEKESQLSQLHQQCAVLLDEQQQLNVVAINSPTNSNNNGTNASNSGTNNNNRTNDNDLTINGNNTVRCKRLRTSFKHNQLKEMKRWFSKNQNPDAKDLKTLAQTTGLTKRVLQVWFQNSRAKFRRNNPKVANQQIYGVNHQQHAPHLLQYQQQHQQTNHQQPAAAYHNHDQIRQPPPPM